MKEPCYRFFGFELDPHVLELRGAAGEPISLGRKPFDLLLFLVRHRERVVSREELLDAVWPDTVVSDGSLSTAVRQIRKVLEAGRDAGGPSIRTVTRRGYRFVAPVEVVGGEAGEDGPGEPSAATAEAAPALEAQAAALPASPRLVGRQEVLDGLLGRLRGLVGGLVVVEGPPGFGKTSLGQRLVELADGLGAASAAVRCQAVPGAPALWPVVQLLRQLTRRSRHVPPARDLPPAQSELVTLLQRFGTNYAPDASLEPAAARFVLFDAIGRAVSEATSDGRRWLLWLDDAHLADASTREWLSFIAPQLADMGVLMMVGLRSGGQADHGFAGADYIVLEALSEGDARALIAQLAPEGLSDRRQAAILNAAGGNPLLLCELVRGALDAPPGDNAWIKHIPRTLAAVITTRFRALSRDCQRLLTMAACIGDEFGPARLPVDWQTDLGELLHEACMAGILAPVPRAASRYRFQHTAFRTAIYDACDPVRRAECHGRLAERLERESDYDERTVAELMHHYRAASNHERVVALARTAADQAAAIGAHDAADAHLSLLSEARGPLVVDAASRVELLLQRATSRAALGADAKELQRTYKQAFELAADLESAELMARAALGYAGCLQFRGQPMTGAPPTREEQRLLEVALRAQVEGSVWCVLLEARLGVALVATPAVEEGHRLTRSAVERAETMGDPAILCQALLQRARSLSGPGEARARIAVAEEAMALAQRCQLPHLERDARFERAIARLRSGDMDAAELRQLGVGEGPPADPSDALRRTYWAMLADLADGDLEAAEARLAHASILVRRCNPICATHTLPTYQFEIGRLRGEKGTLSRMRAVEVFHYRPAVWMGYPWLFGLLDAGRMRSARVVHDIVSRRIGELSKNVFYLPALGIAAWAAQVLGDRARARRAYELLLPYEGEVVTSSDGLLVHGPVSHFLGGAATTFGQYDRAHAHYAAAMAQNEKLDLYVPKLLTRKAQAFLLIAQGKQADGRELLVQLSREFRRASLLGLYNDMPAEFRDADDSPAERWGSTPPDLPTGAAN